MPFQLALFDWNGTILDDLEVTYAATIHLFKLLTPHATIPTLEEYRQEFSSAQMLECYYARGVSRAVTGDEMYRCWSAHYESICGGARLADGSKDVLYFLRECGIPAIIVSAAPRETVRHLERLGIVHLFDRMYFEARDKEEAIRHVLDREKVAAHDTFYVGDTIEDIAYGKKAGVTTFGYTKGYNSLDRILEAAPDYATDSFREILSILRANINETIAMPRSQFLS